MTRKDYVLIAAALKRSVELTKAFTPDERYTLRVGAFELAEALARDNPRFDRERFLKAAGVQS